MASNDKITLDLDIDASKADKSLEKFKKDTQGTLSSIEKGFFFLKAAAGAAAAVFAGKAIVNGIKEITKAASDEQDAIQRLNTSLQLSGKYSEKASLDFQNFASNMERTTKFASEAILENGALIQSMARLSEDGLEKATKAAADLSVALGIDLQTASKLVGKAALGNVDAFKKYGIGIKEGKDKTETFANALAVLNSRFGGAAAAQVQTFSGAIHQLGNAYDDVFKAIGRIIVNNPTLIKAIQIITGLFNKLEDLVDDNADMFSELLSATIKFVARGVPLFVDGIGLIIGALQGLTEGVGVIDQVYSTITGGKQGFIDAGDRAEAARKRFENFGITAAKVADQARILANEVNKVNFNDKNFKPPVLAPGPDTSALEADLKEPKKPKKEKKETEQSIYTTIYKAFQEGAKVLYGIFNGDYIQQLADIIGQVGNIPNAVAEAFGNLGDTVTQLVKDLPKNIEKAVSGIAKGASAFAKQFPKLVQQLVKLFPKLAETIIKSGRKVLQTLLDSLPEIINVIFDVIVQVIDSLPDLLERIMKALPDIISALIKGITKAIVAIIKIIPDIIIVFAENLAPIIEAFVYGIIEAIPEIIIALVDTFIVKGGIFKIIVAIIKAIPQIALALVKGVLGGLASGIGNIGTKLGEWFSKAVKLPSVKLDWNSIRDYLTGYYFFKRLADWLSGKKFFDKASEWVGWFFKKLTEVITKIFNGMGNLFGGGGGGGGGKGKGPVTGIPGSPLALGGIVPPGYPNDSYPALLTSGETVVPPDRLPEMMGQEIDYDRLAAIIQSRPVNLTLSLDGQTLAQAVYNARSRGFRI